jgi:hypothetical protein
MQGSLPAGWLAFTGRELNPLDRDEGFQITSSSLPRLFLAQRPITYDQAVDKNLTKRARKLAEMKVFRLATTLADLFQAACLCRSIFCSAGIASAAVER